MHKTIQLFYPPVACLNMLIIPFYQIVLQDFDWLIVD